MKRNICLFVILTQLLAQAAKADTLQFAAKVQNEDLAEEAIGLLHCLSERSDANWEFTGSTSGTHWLRVEEKGEALTGTYHKGKNETAFTLRAGEAETVCEKFYPAPKAEIQEMGPDLPDLSAAREFDSPKRSYLPWALALGAAALTGFFIWRAAQPDHRALHMN